MSSCFNAPLIGGGTRHRCGGFGSRDLGLLNVLGTSCGRRDAIELAMSSRMLQAMHSSLKFCSLRDYDKWDEVHDLLTSADGWFTKGLDILDLKESTTVLGLAS